MKNALFKTFLFFVLLFFSNFGCQEKVDRMDSLIIEANPDPGRSLGNFFIKIYFSKKHFKVKYEFYEGFDRMGFYQNSKVQEILKKYEGNITDGNRELFRKDTEKIRTQYEKYYKRQIILKNKVYKNYLSQVYNVSNITDEVIESEKKEKVMYIHGTSFTFGFYKKNSKNELIASSLDKDNYKTLYELLKNTLGLYRNIYNDKRFNENTFGY